MTSHDIIESILDDLQIDASLREIVRMRLQNLGVVFIQEFLTESREEKTSQLKDLFQGFAEDFKQ